jgi:hypothetical protein
VITINVKASRRLYELADEARTEREHWKSDGHRAELAHISDQLEHAARLALSSSEAWCDAWCEAGVLTIRKYKAQRLLIENTWASHG